MTFGKQGSVPPRINPYEHGIRVYTREDVTDIEDDGVTFDILNEAIEVHSYNHRKCDDFSAYPRPTKDPLKLVLPEGVGPEEPIMQLARASLSPLTGFGFGSAIAVDSQKAIASWRITEPMAEWIEGIGSRHSEDTGTVLFVERIEDVENPRLHNLRSSLSKITVPRLTIVTVGAPEEGQPCREVVLEKNMLQPDLNDPGPGMGML